MSAGPLISVHDLAGLLGSVTVLDVRYAMSPDREAYVAGHVPGAAYVDLDTALAGRPGHGRGRHPLPEVGVFQEAMQEAGVAGDRPVVVYDDWQGRAAARAWWLLRFHGHEDVRVLDGGWTAWSAAGLEVATGEESPVRGGFRASGGGGMPVVDALSVQGVQVVVDARAAERYRGDVEPIDPVAGRIPDAVNVPTTENVTSDGTFRSPEELREVYAAVGAVDGTDVAAYCGSGVTAAHDVLAMAVAGVRAALYPGSWSEWVSDPARPVATG